MRRQTDNETPARHPKEAPRMTTGHCVVLCAALAAAIVLTGVPSFAQHITGTPGSPDATTTIDGRYLPPPPQAFRGQIALNADRSQPAWPRTKGSPSCAHRSASPYPVTIHSTAMTISSR